MYFLEREEGTLVILQIRNLSFSYSHTPVIQNLSFDVEKGEFASFIGPSGCGKSTLFKVLGGLLHPDKGEITLGEGSIVCKRGYMGYMPQQDTLFPWYTVERNISLSQKLQGLNFSEEQICAWLRKAGLSEVASSYPEELSGGMKQRVAFIRALASYKEVVCLDEPFGALDSLTRFQMYAWISSLKEMKKRTILFITHSIEEVMLLSDRIFVLTDKPMRIKKEVIVPFPQKDRLQLRGERDFWELQQEIEQELFIDEK
jgi:ABC-type nitrate/sulfonate/bicarbonate transport system ATPase subunit